MENQVVKTDSSEIKTDPIEYIDFENAPIVYDITDEMIKNIENRFLPLRVKKFDDKNGFELVVKARKVTNKFLKSIEEQRKNKKSGAWNYGKRVDAEAKRITGLLLPIKTHLEEQEAIVKEEKKRREQEKQRQIEEKHAGQVKQLIDLGCHFDGSAYWYGENKVNDSALYMMEEEIFVFLIEKITLWADREKLRKEEEEKARKEEEERQDKIAEENRKRQEELDRKEREQAEIARKQREEQEAIESEKRRIQEAKEREESQKREAEELEKAKAQAAEEEKRRIEKEARRKEQEEKRKAEEERLRLEEEEKQKPDKEKIKQVFSFLENLEKPVFKTKKYNSVFNSLQEEIRDLLNQYRKNLKI